MTASKTREERALEAIWEHFQDGGDWGNALRVITDFSQQQRREPTTTPECVAVDKILRWDEVKEGDLALVEGVMMQVEQIYPADEERVVFRWSDGYTREHRLADLTAVTRYETTKD